MSGNDLSIGAILSIQHVAVLLLLTGQLVVLTMTMSTARFEC